ncbi:hypothetical protein JFU37_02680 [Pseudomonas sp. TH41]|uniref:hypothetical protein n=1 Tax=Pseudomonas sp. TH41 TaxID=2796405 RepID=UPI0019127894|nr:hypothetical protein [Pseudomonas sp. TH41]MBK5351434.1 hypothetical protein [Pseudomonas sp. TH41]
MKSKLMPALILCATFSQAQAADSPITLEFGAAVKNVSEVNVASGTSSLNMIAEGAGKLVSQGESVRFYALCAITDTLKGKAVVAGLGDCEFKTTDGGVLYAHFQTTPGHGDQGQITLSGGSQNLERFNGIVPIEITVNPAKVGKLVFFAENLK